MYSNVTKQTMRLIQVDTGSFSWFEDPKDVKYAILSHVWDKFPPEQSYQEMVKIQEEVKDQRSGNPDLPSCAVLARLRPKIRECCKRAREDSIEFVWVDSCCIDKTSSGELTEAINSMFEWYSRAAVCYAFLADVSPEEDPLGVPSSSSTFRQSKWFKRCWTLQELIAPKALRFFSADWTLINGKHELAVVIEEVTGIDADILLHKRPLQSVSVAKRMFWASGRVATRKEDEAYSLMGIFDVNIPTIYGEGSRAFLRLQEEILRSIPDDSLFVWDSNFPDTGDKAAEIDACLLLAPSPSSFSRSGSVERVSMSAGIDVPLSTYSVTPYGIRANIAFFPLEEVYPRNNTPMFSTDSQLEDRWMKSRFIPQYFGNGAPKYCLFLLECRDSPNRQEQLALILNIKGTTVRDPSVTGTSLALRAWQEITSTVQPVYFPYPNPRPDSQHSPGSPDRRLQRVVRVEYRSDDWRRLPRRTALFFMLHRRSMLRERSPPVPVVHAIGGEQGVVLATGPNAHLLSGFLPTTSPTEPSPTSAIESLVYIPLALFEPLFGGITESAKARGLPPAQATHGFATGVKEYLADHKRWKSGLRKRYALSFLIPVALFLAAATSLGWVLLLHILLVAASIHIVVRLVFTLETRTYFRMWNLWFIAFGIALTTAEEGHW